MLCSLDNAEILIELNENEIELSHQKKREASKIHGSRKIIQRDATLKVMFGCKLGEISCELIVGVKLINKKIDERFSSFLVKSQTCLFSSQLDFR